MIRRLLLFIMWFVALPFLSLQAQSPGGVVRTAEGDSTTAANQSMRVVTFKAVPGTERTCYYHRDHLGSTTLITNESGEVVQRVEYLPTGETFIEQQDTSWVSPHKFNGKELDEETGLYYYGARYYDPRLSMWLGTDPMQGKYPGISTYAFCHNNPIMMRDLDGKDDVFNEYGIFQYSLGAGPDIYIINAGNKFTLLKDISLNTYARLQMAANIVGYYAKRVGIRYNMNRGQGYVGISNEMKNENERILAWSTQKGIFLNLSNGKLHEYEYNIYNLMNTLEHEKRHFEDLQLPDYKSSYTRHAEIIIEQMKSENYKKGSDDFKMGMIVTLKEYIHKIRKEEHNYLKASQYEKEAKEKARVLGYDYDKM